MTINTGSYPGVGIYYCKTCGKTLRLDESTDRMPPCSKCDSTVFDRITGNLIAQVEKSSGNIIVAHVQPCVLGSGDIDASHFAFAIINDIDVEIKIRESQSHFVAYPYAVYGQNDIGEDVMVAECAEDKRIIL